MRAADCLGESRMRENLTSGLGKGGRKRRRPRRPPISPGEPHARFEVAAGGNQASRASTCRAAQAPLADPTDCFRDLCCAQKYVAYRAEREGASGSLRADRGLWERRRFRSLSRQRNIFSAGLTSRPSRCGPTMSRSTRLTCTSRPARNSSDACSIALGRRIAKPWPVSHQPRRARDSTAVNRAKILLRW